MLVPSINAGKVKYLLNGKDVSRAAEPDRYIAPAISASPPSLAVKEAEGMVLLG